MDDETCVQGVDNGDALAATAYRASRYLFYVKNLPPAGSRVVFTRGGPSRTCMHRARYEHNTQKHYLKKKVMRNIVGFASVRRDQYRDPSKFCREIIRTSPTRIEYGALTGFRLSLRAETPDRTPLAAQRGAFNNLPPTQGCHFSNAPIKMNCWLLNS
ncbi:hypothetical protein EVAR_88655_1 [Eumeta japonica]|uniref:Uncharacterized protein n=1 Tax=Eumeta variegata TaxID=151549 RepID=A0A4C1Y6E3_EUMVA|nr:hypothetical protein EVAR_88655_1 [Eumeta japonica]